MANEEISTFGVQMQTYNFNNNDISAHNRNTIETNRSTDQNPKTITGDDTVSHSVNDDRKGDTNHGGNLSEMIRHLQIIRERLLNNQVKC